MKQASPIKIFHFHNGIGGGVLSVIRNLLAFKQYPEIENHVIYTINRDQISDYRISNLVGAASEQIFLYSPKWNFYYTCRQLAKLLPDEKAIIVAHDWLELGMISNLGLQNPVVQFVHGAYDYYYSMAIKHSPWIDCYITVAQHIADELVKHMPENNEKIHYLRFPVSDINGELNEKLPGFHIVFAGGCKESKGYPLLPKIEKELIRLGVKANWHIAGIGSDLHANQVIWPSESNVQFHGSIAHENLMQLFCSAHVLLLPSEAEGMPVSVVEAMKAGAVPIVNDLLGGVRELIIEGVTGFLVPFNQPEIYAHHIGTLISDESKRKNISLLARKFAKTHFNPSVNTKIIEEQFLKIKDKSIMKIKQKLYGSRLDHPMLPNLLTYLLRF